MFQLTSKCPGTAVFHCNFVLLGSSPGLAEGYTFFLKAELSGTDGIEEEPCHAVTDLCTCPNGTSISLAVQSLKGIMLLNCDLSAETLSVAKIEILYCYFRALDW